MKKTTIQVAMASPCPYQNKKRPMSRGSQAPNKNYLSLFVITIIIFFGFGQSGALAQNQSPTQAPKENTNQSRLIKGTITDNQGSSLPGATITEIGTTNSAQSKTDGTFQLNTSKTKGTLTITYLGYQPRQISFDTEKESTLTIKLSEDRNTLNAVEINTGYYSVKEKQLTGNISSVKANQIEKQPVSNPLQAMTGRMAGVHISQTSGTPGAGINLTIRGKSSIEAGSNPLYIVDGVPFNSQPLTNELSVGVGVYSNLGASPLNTISPDDISSIEVLKDADATAIYGSRGANGVVLITTKKGNSGQTKITLSASSGISKVSRMLPMLNTQDYLQMRRTAFALDNATPNATDHDLNGSYDQNRYTDWQKELIGGSAGFINTNISLSGGNAQNSFLLSGSYQNQGTVTKGNLGYDRANVHLSSSHTSKDEKLKASFSAGFSHDNTDWINTDFTYDALLLPPNAPELYKLDGSLNWANSSWVNPLRALENTYTSKNNMLTANSTISYRPIKDLELKASLGYTSQGLKDNSKTPSSYYDPAEGRTPAQSYSDFNTTAVSSWIIEPQASYQKEIGAGKLGILSGISFQSSQREQTLIRATGFVSDALLENIKGGATTQIRDYNTSTYKYSGIYARANYTLKDRYILNLTGRRDGSSRFGPDRQFANFGAIGAAYIISEENFFKTALPFVSFAKLRASYGTSGNDQIGDYEFLNAYQATIGYNNVPGLAAIRLYNPDFGWEISRKLELGLHLNFLKDRIRTIFSYYRNRSSNQLIDYPLALTTGFASIRNNLSAKVQNSGLEIELSSTNLKRGKLKWETSLNLTVPKNKLLEFPGLETSSYANRYAIGYPLTISKVMDLQGVDPTTGVYRYSDSNGDGIISQSGDRRTIVETGQKFYGGLDNNLTYKNFELSFLFQFVKQTSLSFRAYYSVAQGLMYNQPQGYQGKYWTKPGDNTELQRLTSGMNTDALLAFNNYYYSQAALTDASFIRLKNVQLAYRTEKLIKGKQFRASVQGQNLWTITNYFGLDPESANIFLPPLRTFTLGLSLSL